MRFLFTKSNLLGSKTIRWGLGQDCSHVAFEVTPSGFADPVVIESRLDRGVFAHDLPGLLKVNEIVHSLRLVAPNPAFEDALFESLIKNAVGRKYDRKAFFFWIGAAIAKRALGRSMPTKNPWGTRRDHLCVEVIRGSERIIEDGLGISLSGIDFEMTSPLDLMHILARSPRLVIS